MRSVTRSAVLSALILATVALRATEGQALYMLSIDARLVTYDAAGTRDVVCAPKVTTLVGKEARIVMGEDRVLGDGRLLDDAGEILEEGTEKVFEGVVLQVAKSEVLQGAVRLVGRCTATEVVDVVNTTPPNEGPGSSYAVRSVVTPFALALIPDDDYVAIPGAKWGDKRTELYLKAHLTKMPSRDYEGSVTAQPVGKDAYLVDLRLVKTRENGTRVIVAAPQIVVAQGVEGTVNIGGRTPDGKGGTAWKSTGTLVAQVVEEDGKKVVKASCEMIEDGMVVWRGTLKGEVVAK
jgi:hypothetical protein